MQLINLKNYLDKDYIYVGRPSIWGNPYSSKPSSLLDTIIVSNKDESLSKYEEYIMNNLNLVDDLIKEMNNKNVTKIACFCYPSRCHADILLKLIKEKQNGFEF